MNKVYKSIGIALALILIVLTALTVHIKIDLGNTKAIANATLATTTPALAYDFSGQIVLQEAGSASESLNEIWWVESGAELKIQDGVGRTLEGSLPTDDPFRKEYAMSAPIASDNGYHPQNVFRMLTKAKFQDFEQTLYAKVLGDNLFNQQNSHEWNGLSLLSRYQDENNYYYLGLRMDGQAVIKKKKSGQFSTLAITSFFPGTYDLALNPNLIPKDRRMGLRSRIINNQNGSVTLQLYVDLNDDQNWKLVAEAVDVGGNGGTISDAGNAGVFSDYMNVEFSNYSVNNLGANNTTSTVSQLTAVVAFSTTYSDPIATTSLNASPSLSTSTQATTSSTLMPLLRKNVRKTSINVNPSLPPAATTSASLDASQSTTGTSSAVLPSSVVATTSIIADAIPSASTQTLSNTNSLGEFLVNRTLQEAGSMAESPDNDWWLNSGAYVYFKDGIGSTVHGDLPSSDFWYKAYASANPTDTDGGLHPQNLFRLVSKSTNWKNYVQQIYFKGDKYNLSDSGERDGFNGMLFFNRYADENNLYYTGIRVDGNLEIKKKKNGTYYTMLIAPVFPGTFNRATNPNLLPMNSWIGFRTQIQDTPEGKVDIKVYVDKSGSGDFQLFGEAVDDGSQYGGAIMDAPASVGLRTDFMDAEFKNYQITTL